MATLTDKLPAGEMEDLASLPELSKEILLNELKIRYSLNLIYTYVGDILVSVNPYKSIRGLYSIEQSAKYRKILKSLFPSHIYAIADFCYNQIVDSDSNQCCLISGESGAGKTEATKLIIFQLMELCSNKSHDIILMNSNLENRIIQVNGLLEAFGNAQTAMNDNSSRFGKYIQLKFLQGSVIGAKINEYLLEKSRLVIQDDCDLNFHIFYALFAGLSYENKRRYHLTDPSSFHYINHNLSDLDIKKYSTNYAEMVRAIDLLGFEEGIIDNLFEICSSILHLGNVNFIEGKDENSNVDPSSSHNLDLFSELLGVSQTRITDLMTVSISVARGESFQRCHSKEKAIVCRDSVSKSIYSRTFGWIVNRINSLLAPPVKYNDSCVEIGILDIFGFEHFVNNSFEQLCINLANEQLQFFFNQFIFSQELDIYKAEGIDITKIEFHDNKPLLDLFLIKPSGLLSLLDEQCLFPQATDLDFVSKVIKNFSNSGVIIKSKSTVDSTFSVLHYAGLVLYNANGFIEKNNDYIPTGLLELLLNSTNYIVTAMFAGTLTRTGTLALGFSGGARVSRKSRNQIKLKTQDKKFCGNKSSSLASQFRISLQVLMEKIVKAQPQFIRCIKPNTKKMADSFDDNYVSAQLGYTGMLETTRIRKEGYALRPTFVEFVLKYRALIPDITLIGTSKSAEEVLSFTGFKGWQIGKTRIFLKYWLYEQLGELLKKKHEASTALSKHVRGFLARKKFINLQSSANNESVLLVNFFQIIELFANKILQSESIIFNNDKKRNFKVSSVNTPKINLFCQETNDYNIYKPVLAITPNIDSADSADDSHSNSGAESDDEFNGPVNIKNMRSKFGKEGTKAASVRWFKQTQKNLQGALGKEGIFHDWFHGIISRRQAEMLLTSMPVGSFLLRVSESRFGYSLSVRASNRVKHFMIDQTTSGKYIVVGEPQVHTSLYKLVEYHKNIHITVDGDLLKLPCGQNTQILDYEELLDEDDYSSIPELLSSNIITPLHQNIQERNSDLSILKKKVTSRDNKLRSIKPRDNFGVKRLATPPSPPPRDK